MTENNQLHPADQETSSTTSVYDNERDISAKLNVFVLGAGHTMHVDGMVSAQDLLLPELYAQCRVKMRQQQLLENNPELTLVDALALPLESLQRIVTETPAAVPGFLHLMVQELRQAMTAPYFDAFQMFYAMFERKKQSGELPPGRAAKLLSDLDHLITVQAYSDKQASYVQAFLNWFEPAGLSVWQQQLDQMNDDAQATELKSRAMKYLGMVKEAVAIIKHDSESMAQQQPFFDQARQQLTAHL